MVILILMVMLFQINSKTVIGNRVVYDDKFVTLIGNFDVTVNQGDTEMYAQHHISYPTGFNKNNCVVIACGIYNTTYTNKGLSFGTLSSEGFSASPVKDAYGKSVQLLDEDINLSIYMNYNASHQLQTYPFAYKITLMKLDPDVSDYELGDMNMDGQVTQADYDIIRAFLEGTQTITDKQFKLGDMNSDGVINSGDSLLLLKKIREQS